MFLLVLFNNYNLITSICTADNIPLGTNFLYQLSLLFITITKHCHLFDTIRDFRFFSLYLWSLISRISEYLVSKSSMIFWYGKTTVNCLRFAQIIRLYFFRKNHKEDSECCLLYFLFSLIFLCSQFWELPFFPHGMEDCPHPVFC